MVHKTTIFIVCSVIAFGESSFIDYLMENRCSVKDNECQRTLYTDSIQMIAEPGLPEFGIPSFDPFVIKNVTVSVLGLVDIGMVTGSAKGMKSCVFTRINTTIESYHSTMEIMCNEIIIKGRYRVNADNPLFNNLLGGRIRGDGHAKVKIENFRVLFDFDIFLRESKGEIFIDCKYEDTHYKVNFGKMSFAFDNLYIGDLEVSKQVVPILNSNWKFFMDSFGKPFITTAMDIIYVYTHKFFDVNPARYYLLEDLREWYKN